MACVDCVRLSGGGNTVSITHGCAGDFASLVRFVGAGGWRPPDISMSKSLALVVSPRRGWGGLLAEDPAKAKRLAGNSHDKPAPYLTLPREARPLIAPTRSAPAAPPVAARPPAVPPTLPLAGVLELQRPAHDCTARQVRRLRNHLHSAPRRPHADPMCPAPASPSACVDAAASDPSATRRARGCGRRLLEEPLGEGYVDTKGGRWIPASLP